MDAIDALQTISSANTHVQVLEAHVEARSLTVGLLRSRGLMKVRSAPVHHLNLLRIQEAGIVLPLAY